MKKYLFVFFLSTVYLFSSGFGAPENNVYVRQEQKAEEKLISVRDIKNQELLWVTDQIEGQKQEVEKSEISKSISEKVGEFIMWGFEIVIKTVINLFHN